MHKTNNLISGRTAVISSAENSLGGGRGGREQGGESRNAVIMSGLFVDFTSGGEGLCLLLADDCVGFLHSGCKQTGHTPVYILKPQNSSCSVKLSSSNNLSICSLWTSELAKTIFGFADINQLQGVCTAVTWLTAQPFNHHGDSESQVQV